MADRVDPLAGVACRVEPAGVRRLHLDHALDGADGERDRAGREELPEVVLRLRHPDEARLEDRQDDVRGEAPVAEAHHARADADRDLVELAHVRLGELVVPPVRDEPAHRDPVRDERDVEHEQPDRREPERALCEAVAGERPADHAGEGIPAETRGDERAPADDHHVRVREVADEVACVAGAGEPLGRPGHVLRDHVERPQHEEGAPRDEVLAEPAVVGAELVVRIGPRPDGRRLARHEAEDPGDHDGEERHVRQELERGEMPEVHGRLSAPRGALPQARLDEVDGQRPTEVEEDEDREDHPGADQRPARVADALADVAVPVEGAGRAARAGHQKIFSITRERSGSRSSKSASSRSGV